MDEKFADKKFTANTTRFGDNTLTNPLSVTVHCLNCKTIHEIQPEWVKKHPLSISDKPLCGICKQEMSEEIVNYINTKLK